jgi:hypothetical protein
MKLKCFFILIALLLLLFSSCKVSRKIVSVPSGNADISNIKIESQKLDGLTDNETFVYYQYGGNQNIKYINEVEFQLIKKYNVKYGFDVDFQYNKDKYAIVNVNKYFYRYNFGIEMLRWLFFVPSYGTSLAIFKPRKFSTVTSEVCKQA